MDQYRAAHQVKTNLQLQPTKACVAATEGGAKPLWNKPRPYTMATARCHPDRSGRRREIREEFCGTFLYCYWRAWKGAGEKYKDDFNECLDARRTEYNCKEWVDYSQGTARDCGEYWALMSNRSREG
ncbi:hypothetical protein HIM_08301 [Hirsutella minnesotensis 3608]|uniref:Uncharacterized protein n=1 Tax=Hirsutella minnesotensis 3608 TaxID=1043627 RepID=A0A0F7ZMM5_9HYPO|nr:hypothetical protein HIM_08301 [Hirsutella minnesotensis 3608]